MGTYPPEHQYQPDPRRPDQQQHRGNAARPDDVVDPSYQNSYRRSWWSQPGLTMTYALIGINVAVYALQWLIPGQWMLRQFLFNPLLVEITGQWWRVLTAGFLHSQSDPAHLILNMFSLWLFGRVLEPALGAWRYLVVFVLSILGGSAAVWIWGYLAGPLNINTVGASGGVFGLFGAFFVLTRLRGGNQRPILGMIAVNFIYGLIMPGISWQAHLGGLIAGAVVTWALQKTSRRGRRMRQFARGE